MIFDREMLVLDRKMKLPQTVPRLFWTTQGVRAGPETRAAMLYGLLLRLQRARVISAGPARGRG